MKGFSLNKHGYEIGNLDHAAYIYNQPIKVWRYDPEADQWQEFEESYPGSGAYELYAVSMEGQAIVGLGYNNGDWNAIDIWRFD
ncbi:hypothetical protein [Pontibacter pamirensis]|uniref:hypothetical protein n=1 Tax=Pontibacter pamirensis TaxID=2562824 RepID=UPI0013896219|nr:hypothetical protein [Pontibacter pamirensis]